jgi:transcriptional regulator with XRE-family HTH domain
MSLCPNCKLRPKQKHFNSKWCLPCSEELRTRPKGRLTPEQERVVRRLLHKMPREQIAEKAGVSVATLKRWARDNGNIRLAYYNRWAANPRLVNQVCQYYAKHGRRKTQERFPGITVRSIVERYRHDPRRVRWTDEQLKELARMAGLVSMEAQAKYFNRPNANVGSIKSAWMKRFGHGSMNINGLSWWVAREFVRASCPRVQTKFWDRSDGKVRSCVLWVDMKRHLRKDAPEWLRDVAEAMSNFQRWLHGTDQVRARIKRMIHEREQ